jgi:Tol biopolymer transport system component
MNNEKRWMRFVLGVTVGVILLQMLVVGLVTAAAQHLPAGEVIAYVSPGKAGEDIFVLDVYMGLAYNLTHRLEHSNEREPAWSPDGSQIAFSSWHQRFRVANIFVMDIDGGNLRQLTRLDTDYDFSPSWSPDGSQIAYVSRRDSSVSIRVMDADGQNKRSITAGLIPVSSPSWSADGHSIVFAHYEEASGDNLYMIDADGNGGRRLIDGAYINPVWSPDGAHIGFLRRGVQALPLLVLEIDSGNVREFSVPADSYELAWLPDSQRIAFVSDDCPCGHEVYVLDIESGDTSRFPFGGYLGSVPVWRPT